MKRINIIGTTEMRFNVWEEYCKLKHRAAKHHKKDVKYTLFFTGLWFVYTIMLLVHAAQAGTFPLAGMLGSFIFFANLVDYTKLVDPSNFFNKFQRDCDIWIADARNELLSASRQNEVVIQAALDSL